jgi:hypothetical protein
MPNPVKCLRDAKEGCRAVLSVIDGAVNSADETTCLFNCGVLRSEAELRWVVVCNVQPAEGAG